MKRRATEKPRGYAALPGTYCGLEKPETCGTCAHTVDFGRFKKCGLVRGAWTHGRATDILVRTPACRRWESKE